MSLALAWAYFHALYEQDSSLATNSLVVAPNLIVFERLRQDFKAGRIFRTDPVIPPEWRHDFDVQVCLRNEAVPESAPGVLGLTNIQALYERPLAPPRDSVSAMLGVIPPANLSAREPLLIRMARRGRVMVIDDAAHHLHDEVKSETGEPLVAIQTLRRLHKLAQGYGGGVVGQFDFTQHHAISRDRFFRRQSSTTHSLRLLRTESLSDRSSASFPALLRR